MVEKSMTKQRKIGVLVNVAFKVNYLSDKYNVTEDFIRNGIRDRNLFDLLQEYSKKETPCLGNDFSSYSKEQLDYMYDILDIIDNRCVKEDFGIHVNYFKLLLAFILECINTENYEKVMSL